MEEEKKHSALQSKDSNESSLALEIHNLKKDLWDFHDTLKIQREIIDAQKERLDSIEEEYKKYLKRKNFILAFIKKLFSKSKVNDEVNKSNSDESTA